MTGFSFNWIEDIARRQPTSVALIDLPSGRHFTYGEMATRVSALASALSDDFEIEPGDRVSVCAKNRADHFVLQFACWRAGAIFTPLNWRLSNKELAAVLEISSPKLAIFDSANACTTSSSQPVLMEDLQEGVDRLVESSAPRAAPFQSASDQRVLTLLFTSGTTGKPKAVPYTERMVMCAVVHAAAHAMTNQETKSLVLAPLFHSAGLFAATTPAFHFGGSVVVGNVWDADDCLGLLTDKSLGISHFNGVPTIFKQLAELPQFADADLSHIRLLGIGSAPISRELLEQWSGKGVRLTQSYGLTEAFGVAITPLDDVEQFVGSAGLPMMHSQIRLMADGGRGAETGEVGEIWVRGASVLPHYWGESAAGEDSGFVDGWLRTGDLGMRDERGALFIVDRVKDMIISGGENIYPAEIEHVIAQHPAVRCVAVVGAQHEIWGEVPVAVVEPREGQSLDREELRGFCLESLARYKVPQHWFEVEAIEHTAQGKVAKPELSADVMRALAGDSAGSALKPMQTTPAAA